MNYERHILIDMYKDQLFTVFKEMKNTVKAVTKINLEDKYNSLVKRKLSPYALKRRNRHFIIELAPYSRTTAIEIKERLYLNETASLSCYNDYVGASQYYLYLYIPDFNDFIKFNCDIFLLKNNSAEEFRNNIKQYFQELDELKKFIDIKSITVQQETNNG